MEYSINGSFAIIRYKGKFLWVKRADTGLWELVGGGEDRNEFNHKGALSRECREEIGKKIKQKKFYLFAMLGQTLSRAAREKFDGTKYGSVFLYYCDIIRMRKNIQLSNDHTEHNFFSHDEIMENWEKFTSGSLWIYFTFLAFQENGEIQEGLLKKRKTWKGTDYLYIPPKNQAVA